MKAFVSDVLRVMRLDFVRLWWLWLLWLCLVGFHLWTTLDRDELSSSRFEMLPLLLVAFFVAIPMILFGNRVDGVREWWRTRPLDRRAVAVAKIATVMLLMVICAATEGVYLTSVGFDFFPSVISGMAQRWFIFTPMFVLLLAWSAAVTGKWINYIGCGLLLVATVLIDVVPDYNWPVSLLNDQKVEAKVGLSRVWQPILFSCVAALSLLQLYCRRNRLFSVFILLVGGVVIWLLFSPRVVPSGVSSEERSIAMSGPDSELGQLIVEGDWQPDNEERWFWRFQHSNHFELGESALDRWSDIELFQVRLGGGEIEFDHELFQFYNVGVEGRRRWRSVAHLMNVGEDLRFWPKDSGRLGIRSLEPEVVEKWRGKEMPVHVDFLITEIQADHIGGLDLVAGAEIQTGRERLVFETVDWMHPDKGWLSATIRFDVIGYGRPLPEEGDNLWLTFVVVDRDDPTQVLGVIGRAGREEQDVKLSNPVGWSGFRRWYGFLREKSVSKERLAQLAKDRRARVEVFVHRPVGQRRLTGAIEPPLTMTVIEEPGNEENEDVK